MKILIIKLGALGDVIISTPVINRLLQYHKEDEVWILTTSNFYTLFSNWDTAFNIKLIERGKIIDNLNNTYNFSQIYIDTKKRELLGTDSKSYINNSDFKINTDNKPRIFANTVKINEEFSEFNKSNFNNHNIYS